MEVLKKCSWPENVSIKPDGVNELDPCPYEEIEAWRNVTVHILRCPICGHREIVWERQPDTEEAE